MSIVRFYWGGSLSSWLVSGDVFAVVKQYEPTLLTPYSLRLHLIEADRVATPTTSGIITPMLLTTGKAANGNTIYDGVEVNGDGQIEAYHIRSTYPFELGSTTTTWARVQAYGERTGLPNIVALLAEGVDRNNLAGSRSKGQSLSPSSRRAWIEISWERGSNENVNGRPPRGGRG